MTRECDETRHFAGEQHSGITWDQVHTDDQYQRTSHNFGRGISGGISLDVGGASINIGTGGRYRHNGGYDRGNAGYDNYNSYFAPSQNYYPNSYASSAGINYSNGLDGYGNGGYRRYSNSGGSYDVNRDVSIVDTDTSREATRCYYEQQQQYNQGRYQNFQQPDGSFSSNYNNPQYDRYVIGAGGDEQYEPNNGYAIPQNGNLGQTGDQNDQYTNGNPNQGDRYSFNQGYPDHNNDSNSDAQISADQASDPDQYAYSNPFDLRCRNRSNDLSQYSADGRYDQGQGTSQFDYGNSANQQYTYDNQEDSGYRYDNRRQPSYSNNRYDNQGYGSRYSNDGYAYNDGNGYANDYYQGNGDDWTRMRSVLQSMLGHSPSEFNRNVPDDLGCATVVSSALRLGYGLRITDTNVDGLEQSLRRNGFEAIPVQYAKPGDCIIAHRPNGRHGHAAIYVGNGKVVNNSSSQGRVVVASLDKFASREYDSVVAYRKV